ncbi:MAG TPA: glycosyltransferase family 2 protein [Vicinamibacterales bacterium]|nr:glycosyltransferase family 2 protein [Vicinamibacterales bacterium]
MKYSVVVPVYRNEATLPELLRQLAVMQEPYAGSLEVVFVIDGSPDNSHALLKAMLPEMPFSSQLIAFSRNFGSFAAIRAGLAHATGDFAAVLAADLQQPVSSVRQFFDALERGADIAVGQRASRDDPWLSRTAATMFWRLYRRFVQPQMPPGGMDSFGCTRLVRDVLVSLPEANSALTGLLFWVGYRREEVTYPRLARASGRSGWSLGRKTRYAFDTTFAFSDLPITIMIIAGAVGISASVAVGATVLVAWAAGAIDVRGYTPLLLAVLFAFSTTLLALGIVGGYVWRIFENTKGRPTYLVSSVERIAPAVHATATARPV